MKSLFFSFAFCLLLLTGSAQKGDNAIGLRAGFGAGITFQHYMSKERGFEAILNTYRRGYVITGLYEVHADAFDVPGLKWYYGAGAHLGVFAGYWNDNYRNGFTVVGVDGILGMEYFINEIPFVLSADWKPAINLVGYTSPWIGDGAISVRYIF
jgi:hypothetical protein